MAASRDKDAFVNTAHRIIKTEGLVGLGELLDDIATTYKAIGIRRCAECSHVIAILLDESFFAKYEEEEDYFCENCIEA